MRKKMVVLIAAVMLAIPVASFGAVNNDEVTSAKIKEATAGSTSQDTNSGNGIKTGHIVDTAITTAKIANGAVTDAKISGQISVSKLPVGTTSATVAAGDHNHDAVYAKKYANVIVVAQSGGDFTDPSDAINSITNASATMPYLVKIMPGTYESAGTIVFKSFVTVEGSGRQATRLVGATEVANGSTNVEIKNLSMDSLNVPSSNQVNVSNVEFFGQIYSFDSALTLDGIKQHLSNNGETHIWAIQSEGRWNGNSYGPAKLIVKNSDISVITEQNYITSNSYVGVAGINSTLDIETSEINVVSGVNNAYGVYRPTSVANSKITVSSTQQYSAGIEVLSPAKVYNSYVDAPMFVYFYAVPSSYLKCSNTVNSNLVNICPAP